MVHLWFSQGVSTYVTCRWCPFDVGKINRWLSQQRRTYKKNTKDKRNNSANYSGAKRQWVNREGSFECLRACLYKGRSCLFNAKKLLIRSTEGAWIDWPRRQTCLDGNTRPGLVWNVRIRSVGRQSEGVKVS